MSGTRREAAQTLHVAPDAPLAVAEAAWRALSKSAHPDAGGSDAAMARLNAAIDTIRATRPDTVGPAVLADCGHRPAEAVQRLPWGKFRGIPLADVPVSYLGWILDNVDDATVRLAARRVLHWRVA